MTCNDYEHYLTLFNARDYDGVLAHFADRFELVFAGHVFRTRDEVRRLYGFLHDHVEERVVLKAFVADARMAALEADVQLTGIKSMTPELLAAQGLERIVSLPAGATVTIPQFIHYHFDEAGRIVRALCAVYEPPVVD